MRMLQQQAKAAQVGGWYMIDDDVDM